MWGEGVSTNIQIFFIVVFWHATVEGECDIREWIVEKKSYTHTYTYIYICCSVGEFIGSGLRKSSTEFVGKKKKES